MDTRPPMIFSGFTSRYLAEAICKELGVELSNNDIKKFADGEIYARMEDTVRGRDCFIVQSTCAPVNDNLMSVLINIDALRRASAGRITAVIPYFGYARQDRKANGRDPITAKLVANMITAAGADRVLTMDLHASQEQGFFDIPVDHLSGTKLFADYYSDIFKLDQTASNFVAVSPDVGSVARTRAFAQMVHMDLAIVDKRRAKANDCEVMNIIGDVKGKICLMIDDMTDTAGSLINGAEALLDIGGAKAVYAAASHGVLSPKRDPVTGELVPAIEKIRKSRIKELMLLDTIPAPAGMYMLYGTHTGVENPYRITYISTAKTFASAIRCIHEETSISQCNFGAK